MNWQILATIGGVVAGIVVPALGLLNAWLLVQIRVEITKLKIEMLEQQNKDKNELRSWVETRMDTVNVRLHRIETRRPHFDKAA